MTRMLTTWQDLAALGWSIPRVYDKLNAKRGNTMDEMGQLSLNDGPALGSNGWYCYNDFKGDPHPQTPTYTSTTTEEVVWEYVNNTDDVLSVTCSENWQHIERVESSVTRNAIIPISGNVTIQNVMETGFSFTFGHATTELKSREHICNLSHTWIINVLPHRKSRLVRTKVATFGVQEHHVTCGLADNPNDRIGTTGTKWDGSTNWAYSVNAALDNPSKRMIISSTLYKDRYTFRLENITADINSTSSETEVGDTDEWAEW